MAFKDVLLALTTYPEPTQVSAVDESIAFAAAVGARISAIACEVKMRVPGSPLGSALLNIPAMAAAEAKKSSTNAEKLLVAFQDAAEKHGIFQERILEQCLTSEVPEVFVGYARLSDLESTGFFSRSQSKYPHFLCVLPIADEFRERIGF
jgi:hypothetical protein